jgi:hypothetical protein
MRFQNGTRLAAVVGTAVAASIVTMGVQAVAQPRETGQAPLPESAPASLVENVAALREKPASPELGKTQADPLTSEKGGNTSLAVKTVSTVSGDSVLLTPTRDGACLGTAKLGIITCATTDHALAGSLAASITCSPSLSSKNVAFFGVFPDGVASVTGRFSDGSMAEYPVRNNTLSLELALTAPAPEAFAWTRNGKQFVTPSQMPSKELENAPCAPTQG